MKILLLQSSTSGHTDSRKSLLQMFDCIQAGIQWKWKCELLRYTTWGLEENEKVDEGTNRVLSKEKIDTEILLSSIKSIQ